MYASPSAANAAFAQLAPQASPGGSPVSAPQNRWFLDSAPSGPPTGSYYGQYTNPAPYQPYQAPSGNVSVNTGVNVTPPTLPDGAVSRLMAYPTGAVSGTNYGSVPGSYSRARGALNDFYNQSLYGNNVQAGAGLQNLFNQTRAGQNMALGQLQGQLSQQGMGLAAGQQAFNLNQQLTASNILRGLYGGMFGNLFGLMGNL